MNTKRIKTGQEKIIGLRLMEAAGNIKHLSREDLEALFLRQFLETALLRLKIDRMEAEKLVPRPSYSVANIPPCNSTTCPARDQSDSGCARHSIHSVDTCMGFVARIGGAE